VSFLGACPRCSGELQDLSIGPDEWTMCAACRICWRLGSNLWTPPHLIGIDPRDVGPGFASWDAYYADVAARLSACVELE